MKTLNLGTCCPDCFAALNYTQYQLPPSAAARAKAAGEKLSLLCDTEGAKTIHTGDYEGFSRSVCAGCGSDLAGDRWKLVGLQESRKDTGT